MPDQCFAFVRGKTVRVTQLDECGVATPVTGMYAVSDGFVTAALAGDWENGEEILVKNAHGDFCINERSKDILKRVTVTIDWCQVDPELVSLVTGYPAELQGTDTYGFRVQAGSLNVNYAVELWTELPKGSCGVGEQCFGYVLIPFIEGGRFGDLTIENAAATFQTVGYANAGSGWDVGPWDVVGPSGAPTPLEDPIGPLDIYVPRVTCVAPPAAACGAVPIPAA